MSNPGSGLPQPHHVTYVGYPDAGTLLHKRTGPGSRRTRRVGVVLLAVVAMATIWFLSR
jgi:hypothetical protein